MIGAWPIRTGSPVQLVSIQRDLSERRSAVWRTPTVADWVSRTLISGPFRQHVGTFVQGASRDHGPSIGMRTLDGPPSRHGGGRHQH